jgi:hypothetical protein
MLLRHTPSRTVTTVTFCPSPVVQVSCARVGPVQRLHAPLEGVGAACTALGAARPGSADAMAVDGAGSSCGARLALPILAGGPGGKRAAIATPHAGSCPALARRLDDQDRRPLRVAADGDPTEGL